MFIVEYLTDPKTPVFRENMLGDNAGDVLKLALSHCDKVQTDHRVQLKAIRILDAAKRTITVHQFGSPDAKGA
jgi:hypothetical protein